MQLRDNIEYWLLSEEEPAVRWRATSPVEELASHLIALNDARRNRNMKGGFFVTNAATGYINCEPVDAPTSNEEESVYLELPMPTAAEAQEYRREQGKLTTTIDGLIVHDEDNELQTNEPQLDPEGVYLELPLPTMVRRND